MCRVAAVLTIVFMAFLCPALLFLHLPATMLTWFFLPVVSVGTLVPKCEQAEPKLFDLFGSWSRKQCLAT